MRREQEQIVIQDPAVRHLERRGGACARRGCGVLIGVAMLLGVAIVVGAKLIKEPSPQRVATLPGNFPTDIPLFEFQSRSEVTVLTREAREKRDRVARPVGRLILAPALKLLEPVGVLERTGIPIKRIPVLRNLSDLKHAVVMPDSPNTDIVRISWEGLAAGAGEVEAYYQTTLAERGYTVERVQEYNGMRTFRFTREQVTGKVEVISGATDEKKLERVVLEVEYE